MAAAEIREHTIDDTATVFFFARAYEDDRASAAAYDRARAKIGARDNTSVFRVQTPDGGRQLLFVLSATRANAKRAASHGAARTTAPPLMRSRRSALVCARSPKPTHWTRPRAGAASADWPWDRRVPVGRCVAPAAEIQPRASSGRGSRSITVGVRSRLGDGRSRLPFGAKYGWRSIGVGLVLSAASTRPAGGQDEAGMTSARTVGTILCRLVDEPSQETADGCPAPSRLSR